jgi:predicted transcriptional regulator
VTDEELLKFIEAHMKSVWAVEQMLVMTREPVRVWALGELVRETRSSSTAVGEALRNLEEAGLVDHSSDSTYRFAPKSEDLRTAAEALLKAYVERPRFVIRAIFAEPKDNLRIFADAFRLKKK